MENKPKYKLTGYEKFITDKHPDCPIAKKDAKRKPYIAQPGLAQAVNLAIRLKRPLLLEGEAGCGKTLLAYDIACEIGLPFYTWHVRSTSKVQDGLYSYDAILRLHDVQIAKMSSTSSSPKRNPEDPNTSLSPKRNPEDPNTYLKLKALGKAFKLENCPAVILIDEIDKADIDFPNDLLSILDDYKFDIPEINETVEAKHTPIIIITSNKEKGNLPAPFLRRCIYYFVEFPDKKFLQQIVDEHYKDAQQGFSNPQQKNFVNLSKAAIDKFVEIRKKDLLHKKPGTSEFLDWLNMLQSFDSKPYDSTLLETTSTIPYPELLFKLRADWMNLNLLLRAQSRLL
jgi:MoxR-like ATPase